MVQVMAALPAVAPIRQQSGIRAMIRGGNLRLAGSRISLKRQNGWPHAIIPNHFVTVFFLVSAVALRALSWRYILQAPLSTDRRMTPRTGRRSPSRWCGSPERRLH